MGGSKAQTVGYWYHPTLLLGLHQGPYDAFLRLRGGDVDAWRGEITQNATIYVNAPEIWGGTDSEGGIQGYVDLMFGDDNQLPNAAYQLAFGGDPSAHRSDALLYFNGGRYGAMNPYPKPLSVLTRRIFRGWDNGGCWYPSKALIPISTEEIPGSAIPELADTSPGWRYLQVANNGPEDYSAPDFNDSAWPIGTMPFASLDNHIYTAPSGFPAIRGTTWPINSSLWLRKKVTLPTATQVQMQILIDNFATIWVNGHMILGPESGHDGEPNLPLNFFDFTIPGDVLNIGGENTIVIKAKDTGLWTYVATRATAVMSYSLAGMNPAHMIYDCLTATCGQGEPVGLINDASFRAAADKLHAEGFALCTDWAPAEETPEEFRQRICNVIGAQCTRSNVDGLWYLDLARDDFDIDSLPILTDDNVLDFELAPTTLDDAVNQMSVGWFDPDTKQARTTPGVHALGTIQAMGGIVAERSDYPEIPIETLANRCALRDLIAKATPGKRFNLVCDRTPYSWRRGTYFRAQLPRRGIADMVCMVGEIDKGTLRSKAIKLVMIQHVGSMPSTSYVVGTPPPNPGGSLNPVAHQVAFEAPYVELAAVLSTADLAALDPDAGFVQVAGVWPAGGLNYQLQTRIAGGEFDPIGSFDWCPSAIVNEAADREREAFTFSAGSDLDRVQVGSAALWGSEIVRVVTLDVDTGTLTLGRACGDTVTVKHVAGERIYFYDAWAGTDQVEYIATEVVESRLLTRTGSAILPAADATIMTVTLNQRAARPYPPAGVRINDEIDPSALSGALTVTWAHRDRVLQADQLVDQEAASIGPEAGTTYTLRWYLDDVLVHTHSGVAGDTQGYTPGGEGHLRLEVESERDGLASWQAQVREFYYTPTPADFLGTESGDLVTLEDGSPITLE